MRVFVELRIGLDHVSVTSLLPSPSRSHLYGHWQPQQQPQLQVRADTRKTLSRKQGAKRKCTSSRSASSTFIAAFALMTSSGTRLLPDATRPPDRRVARCGAPTACRTGCELKRTTFLPLRTSPTSSDTSASTRSSCDSQGSSSFETSSGGGDPDVVMRLRPRRLTRNEPLWNVVRKSPLKQTHPQHSAPRIFQTDARGGCAR